MRSIDDLLREREREIKERIRWAKRNNTDVRKNDRGGHALDEEERGEEKWQEGGKVTVNERRFNVMRLCPSDYALHMHEIPVIHR